MMMALAPFVTLAGAVDLTRVPVVGEYVNGMGIAPYLNSFRAWVGSAVKLVLVCFVLLLVVTLWPVLTDVAVFFKPTPIADPSMKYVHIRNTADHQPTWKVFAYDANKLKHGNHAELLRSLACLFDRGGSVNKLQLLREEARIEVDLKRPAEVLLALKGGEHLEAEVVGDLVEDTDPACRPAGSTSSFPKIPLIVAVALAAAGCYALRERSGKDKATNAKGVCYAALPGNKSQVIWGRMTAELRSSSGVLVLTNIATQAVTELKDLDGARVQEVCIKGPDMSLETCVLLARAGGNVLLLFSRKQEHEEWIKRLAASANTPLLGISQLSGQGRVFLPRGVQAVREMHIAVDRCLTVLLEGETVLQCPLHELEYAVSGQSLIFKIRCPLLPQVDFTPRDVQPLVALLKEKNAACRDAPAPLPEGLSTGIVRISRGSEPPKLSLAALQRVTGELTFTPCPWAGSAPTWPFVLSTWTAALSDPNPKKTLSVTGLSHVGRQVHLDTTSGLHVLHHWTEDDQSQWSCAVTQAMAAIITTSTATSPQSQTWLGYLWPSGDSAKGDPPSQNQGVKVPPLNVSKLSGPGGGAVPPIKGGAVGNLAAAESSTSTPRLVLNHLSKMFAGTGEPPPSFRSDKNRKPDNPKSSTAKKVRYRTLSALDETM